MNDFLPVNQIEMKDRGWDSLDFLLVSGDAYVDHPSFGHAILGRLLEDEGYRVGIIAQPDWNNAESFKRMGTPMLGVLISPGVLDSMVNNYTASGLPRRKDSYSPGGERGPNLTERRLSIQTGRKPLRIPRYFLVNGSSLAGLPIMISGRTGSSVSVVIAPLIC